MINITIEEKDSDLKLFKAIVIAKETGEPLIDIILDSDINPIMLSAFVSALRLFGKDNLGKIEEINIKGINIGMIIVYRYHLVLVAITDKKLMKGNLREEAEMMLDWFHTLYKKELKKVIKSDIFESFKDILYLQIKEYLEKINLLENEKEKKDLGFITESINKFNNKSD